MKDLIHLSSNWFSYNRYTVLAGIAAAFVVFAGSCQVTTKSPTTGESVTREELVVELGSLARADKLKFDKLSADYKAAVEDLAAGTENYKARYEAAVADIDRKQQMIDSALGWLNTTMGTLSSSLGPAGNAVWGLAATLLAGGIFGDNKRKDLIIKKQGGNGGGGAS